MAVVPRSVRIILRRVLPENWLTNSPQTPAVVSPRKIQGKWVVVTMSGANRPMTDEQLAQLKQSAAVPNEANPAVP